MVTIGARAAQSGCYGRTRCGKSGSFRRILLSFRQDFGFRQTVGSFLCLCPSAICLSYWEQRLIAPPTHSAIPTLGAVLILVAIAIDPFSQAVIDYAPCQRPDDTDVAQIPRTNRWNWVNTLPNETSHWFETNFIAGLLTPPSNTSSLINVHCPSGNCTFPADQHGSSFSSLAMCYSCDDITDQVEEQGGQYSLPPYPRTIPGDSYTQFFTPPVMPINHTSQEDVDSFFSFSSVMLNHPGMDPVAGCIRTNSTSGVTTGSTFENCKSEPFAFNCSLTPCIKTYKASIENFVYQETEVSRELLRPSRLTTGSRHDDPGWKDWLGYYPMYSLATEEMLIDGTWHKCEHRDQNETGYPVAVNREKKTLEWHLDGVYGNDTVFYSWKCTWILQSFPFWWTYEWVRGQISNITMDDGDIRKNGPPRHQLDPTWARRLYNRGNASMDTVHELMEGIADTMTVYMRHYSQEDDDIHYSKGTIMVNDTCVSVQWEWMSFLAIMLLLTLVFLVATIAYWYRGNWREDWKSSSLAVLFHGVEPPRRGLLRQGEIYKASKDVKVQLQGDGDDWRFKRVDGDPIR